MANIIVAIIVFGIVAGVIYKKFERHKKGEGTCGCSCSHYTCSKSCLKSKGSR